MIKSGRIIGPPFRVCPAFPMAANLCALPYLVGDAVPMLCPQVHQHLAHLSERRGRQAQA